MEERFELSHFPPKASLPVYGDDCLMPESVDDLKCEYNEKEGTPPLKLEELRGFRVPPPGITSVTVNGMGMRAGVGPIVYPVNTFRENKHGLGMELGTSHIDAVAKREELRRDAVDDGIIEYFEEQGLHIFDNLRDKSPQTIKRLTYMTLKFIVESENPKEMLNFLKYIDKKQEHKGEVLDRLTKKPSLTIDEAREWLALTKDVDKDEVVDAKLYDVDEGEKAE